MDSDHHYSLFPSDFYLVEHRAPYFIYFMDWGPGVLTTKYRKIERGWSEEGS